MLQASRIDPILFEIISHELQSIPDQVEVDLTRTAFSPLIYEYKDYAVGLVDPQGRSVALAQQGGPGFVVNLIGLGAREAVECHGDALKPGDVIITNNPATVGHHLNDVVMVTPIFDETGALAAFMGIIAHWIDIGGRYPNSSSGTDTTEIFQEGLQLNALHLRREGRPVPEVYSIIRTNSRFPEPLMGDIEAQLTGCLKGAALYAELLARRGRALLDRAIAEIWDCSARAARDAVEQVPDGRYQMACFLDNDGLTLDQAILIEVVVVIAGADFIVDFSGMSPQVPGQFNSGRFGGGEACARMAFKYLISPESPANEGSFAPLQVILPSGTLVSATQPAPLGRYSVPLPTIVDCIIGAMAAAIPELCTAGHHASFGSYGFVGRDSETGRLFSYFDTAHGGWGASAQGDGTGPFKTMIHGDNRDIPIEVQEALYPVRIDHYGWRPDSGGAGRFRGGLGTIKTFTVLSPCAAQFAFERHGCPPWGLSGGQAGLPGSVEIERAGGDRLTLLKESDFAMAAGDRLHVLAGGGGGYGPPSDRDPVLVAADLVAGLISAQQATEIYGLTIL